MPPKMFLICERDTRQYSVKKKMSESVHSLMSEFIKEWISSEFGVKSCIFTHFGVTSVITNFFLVITEVTPKWVITLQIHS